mmetsp:Transcript_33252/g.75363  ORF Transcript_33252/g.75363 Transcript_33252/m.75363 type:complete len:159 (+) Transcript_33252:21-497(+)
MGAECSFQSKDEDDCAERSCLAIEHFSMLDNMDCERKHYRMEQGTDVYDFPQSSDSQDESSAMLLPVRHDVSSEFPLFSFARVRDPDFCYAQYEEAARQLHLKSFVSRAGRVPEVGTQVMVVGSMHHARNHTTVIIAIQDADGEEYLIGSAGLDGEHA